MAILTRLVAVCDGCGYRTEYESEVRHDERMNSNEYLSGDDVVHVQGLPPDWEEKGGYGVWADYCPNCKEDATK